MRDYLLVIPVGLWCVNVEICFFVNGVGVVLGDVRYVWWCMVVRVDLEWFIVVGDGGSVCVSVYDWCDAGFD